MRSKRSIKSFVYKQLNLPKTICNHIIGKEHNSKHRVTVGAIVMIIGVCIAKIPVGYIAGHVIFETIGFLFHCIGAIPMVQFAEKVANVINSDSDLSTIDQEDENIG